MNKEKLSEKMTKAAKFTIITAFLLIFCSSLVYAEKDVARTVKKVQFSYPFRSDIYVSQWSRLRHLAKLGDPEAQFELGNMYYSPPKKSGFMKSYKKAYNLFLKSARKGNVHAQHNVAVLLLKGQGVKQDQDKALAWFHIAAENGSKNAQRMVLKFKRITVKNIDKLKSELEKNIRKKQLAR